MNQKTVNEPKNVTMVGNVMNYLVFLDGKHFSQDTSFITCDLVRTYQDLLHVPHPLSYLSRFTTYAPSFILGKLFLE